MASADNLQTEFTLSEDQKLKSEALSVDNLDHTIHTHNSNASIERLPSSNPEYQSESDVCDNEKNNSSSTYATNSAVAVVLNSNEDEGRYEQGMHKSHSNASSYSSTGDLGREMFQSNVARSRSHSPDSMMQAGRVLFQRATKTIPLASNSHVVSQIDFEVDQVSSSEDESDVQGGCISDSDIISKELEGDPLLHSENESMQKKRCHYERQCRQQRSTRMEEKE